MVMNGCVVYPKAHLIKYTQIDMIFMTWSLRIERARPKWSLNLLHAIGIFFFDKIYNTNEPAPSFNAYDLYKKNKRYV